MHHCQRGQSPKPVKVFIGNTQRYPHRHTLDLSYLNTKRPVSNLLFLRKISEKVVCFQYLIVLDETNCLLIWLSPVLWHRNSFGHLCHSWRRGKYITQIYQLYSSSSLLPVVSPVRMVAIKSWDFSVLGPILLI